MVKMSEVEQRLASARRHLDALVDDLQYVVEAGGLPRGRERIAGWAWEHAELMLMAVKGLEEQL